jgi:hypothetical protein
MGKGLPGGRRQASQAALTIGPMRTKEVSPPAGAAACQIDRDDRVRRARPPAARPARRRVGGRRRRRRATRAASPARRPSALPVLNALLDAFRGFRTLAQ